MLSSVCNHAGRPPEERIPQSAPVVLVMVDQERGIRIPADVRDPAQFARLAGLGLGVDGVIEGLTDQDEANRHQCRPLPV